MFDSYERLEDYQKAVFVTEDKVFLDKLQNEFPDLIDFENEIESKKIWLFNLSVWGGF